MNNKDLGQYGLICTVLVLLPIIGAWCYVA